MGAYGDGPLTQKVTETQPIMKLRYFGLSNNRAIYICYFSYGPYLLPIGVVNSACKGYQFGKNSDTAFHWSEDFTKYGVKYSVKFRHKFCFIHLCGVYVGDSDCQILFCSVRLVSTIAVYNKNHVRIVFLYFFKF